jgi:hypothetical protein
LFCIWLLAGGTFVCFPRYDRVRCKSHAAGGKPAFVEVPAGPARNCCSLQSAARRFCAATAGWEKMGGAALSPVISETHVVSHSFERSAKALIDGAGF